MILGSYPQIDILGKKKEPIEWFVLEKNEEKEIMMKMTYYEDKNNTVNYVSCLSRAELDKYFDFWREGDKFIENRVSCKPTSYAVLKGLHVNEFSGCSRYNYRLPSKVDYGLDGWFVWAMHFYNMGYTIEEGFEQYKHMYESVRSMICVKYHYYID